MNVKPRACPPQELLTAYGLGKLNETGMMTVARHLEVCPDCQQAVENVSADSFVGRLLAASPPSSSTSEKAEGRIRAV
jgi:anti-sigma factor ChrR (cupin superfamily)